METTEQIKDMVRHQYSEIARQEKSTNQASCCGAGCCSAEVYNIMNDDYTLIEGYAPDADLGLGCGIPTEFARIQTGDVVIDLGSGAGNDAFVARKATGETGRVIGIDFTPAMIELARGNAEKLGFQNVEFRQGDIEKIPVSDNLADVILSNCVLNLVPNKRRAFLEIFRTLKPGGHFSISDIVLAGNLPEKLRQAAEMYAGCVTGAIHRNEYLKLFGVVGFEDVFVQKEKPITIPNDILRQYLSNEEIDAFRAAGTGIFSFTVSGNKPLSVKTCCGPECCQ